MVCRHHEALELAGDGAFTVDSSRVTFGRGCLGEVGERARRLGMTRVLLVTDARVRALAPFHTVRASLRAAGLEPVVFDGTHVEPTDVSFGDATLFAIEARVDGYVSLGGGSVIDTCKAANLYATYPAPLLAYVNAPLGEARAVPGPLAPHIACPTTSGTGSEVTGITIFDLLAAHTKTGIASPVIRPTEALVDPDCTATLPANVVAASGMDVLSHALESFTARPHWKRPKPAGPSARPMSQGANAWSDIGCREALSLAGRYLVRAVADAGDSEAREQVMWAATLAGIAFGNAGVHVPHAMSYSVAGLVRDHFPAGYPDEEPIVPHGMAVIVNAPAVFRATAAVSPARHLEAARLLGAETRGATDEDAGEVLAARLIELMRATKMPNGVGGVGYGEADLPQLVAGAVAQQRLLANAPRPMASDTLREIFAAAMSYW